MKRTTISRSSVPWLAAVLLWAAAPAAHAQDTTQQAPPPQADTLQMAATPQQPTPSTHVVQKGETLWGLAEMYLGDALLWPEIYRLNTMVVEDPHWIYPGEELRFGAPDTTQVAVAPPMVAPAESAAAPVPAESAAVAPQAAERETPVEAPAVEAPPPPPPVAETGRTVFSPPAASAPNSGLGEITPSGTFRAVHRGDFYAAGFLTEKQQLPWGDVTDVLQRATVGGVPASRAAFVYEVVRIRAPEGAEYHVGDSLLVVHIGREVAGGWGEIVMPTGIARVTYANGRDGKAEVIQQFGWVEPGQQTLPLEPFTNPGPVRPQPVDNGVSGHVVALRSPQPVPNQQAVVFLDLGRNDGIVPGDVFAVLDSTRGASAATAAPPTTVAQIHIVHVRDKSSTGLLMNIVMPGLQAGAPVRLVRKMPS